MKGKMVLFGSIMGLTGILISILTLRANVYFYVNAFATTVCTVLFLEDNS